VQRCKKDLVLEGLIKLTELTLTKSSLALDLNKLPNLEYLKIDYYSNIREYLYADSRNHVKLKKIILFDIEDIKNNEMIDLSKLINLESFEITNFFLEKKKIKLILSSEAPILEKFEEDLKLLYKDVEVIDTRFSLYLYEYPYK